MKWWSKYFIFIQKCKNKRFIYRDVVNGVLILVYLFQKIQPFKCSKHGIDCWMFEINKVSSDSSTAKRAFFVWCMPQHLTRNTCATLKPHCTKKCKLWSSKSQKMLWWGWMKLGFWFRRQKKRIGKRISITNGIHIIYTADNSILVVLCSNCQQKWVITKKLLGRKCAFNFKDSTKASPFPIHLQHDSLSSWTKG